MCRKRGLFFSLVHDKVLQRLDRIEQQLERWGPSIEQITFILTWCW